MLLLTYCFILATLSKALALTDEDIIQRFATLEANERRYKEEIALLTAEMNRQHDRLDVQEQIIQSMQNELNTLKTEQREHSEMNTDTLFGFIEPQQSVKPRIPDDGRKKSKLETSERRIFNKRATEGVAFTAYLDHSVTFGQSQTIKFNEVVTNEGNGYSIHTGAFTCPLSGMYLFTFTIGGKGTGPDFVADIVVNSQNVIESVTDPYHDLQDIMGGNTVVVRLNQGDAVWVSVRYAGSHTISSNDIRRTTFTGVYLFA